LEDEKNKATSGEIDLPDSFQLSLKLRGDPLFPLEERDGGEDENRMV